MPQEIYKAMLELLEICAENDFEMTLEKIKFEEKYTPAPVPIPVKNNKRKRED